MHARQRAQGIAPVRRSPRPLLIPLLGSLLVTPAIALGQVRTDDVGAALDNLQRQLLQIQDEAATLQTRSMGLEQKLQLALRERTEAEEARARVEQALAERSQELLDLQAEIARARQENARLQRQVTALQQLKGEKLDRDAELARLEGDRTTLESRYTSLEHQIAELREQQRRIQDSHQSETRRMLERAAALERAGAQKDREIIALRARLPAPEGGTVTADQAREAATAAGENMMAALRAAHGHSDPEKRKAAREAENKLHQAQILLSRSIGARSVYRVRPNDTLARISRRFYVNSGHWNAIFKANLHLLDDPDHLIPGMSLVIP